MLAQITGRQVAEVLQVRQVLAAEAAGGATRPLKIIRYAAINSVFLRMVKGTTNVPPILTAFI
jgi:hypothetical protein